MTKIKPGVSWTVTGQNAGEETRHIVLSGPGSDLWIELPGRFMRELRELSRADH